MKKICAAALTAISLIAAPSFAHAGEQQKQITIKGELIDTACYLAHPDTGRGEEHRNCASMCINGGVPMSVLDEKGDVYLLLPDHSNQKVYDQAKQWAADTVEVTGRLVSQGGLRAIIVEQSKKVSE